MNDLHSYLKSGTYQAHKALDAELIGYDLTDRFELSQYLCVHYLARTSLSEIMSFHNQKSSNQKMLNDIALDLKILEVEPPLLKVNLGKAISHSLGLTYVLAGSSLGSKVLYKQWTLSSDDRVKRAGHFMKSSKDSSDWKTFLARLDTLMLTRPEIEHVVASANCVFEIYQAACDQVNGTVK